MVGYQGYNIQESLLHMRAGSDMYLRRAGWKYAKTQAKLFKFMKDENFIGNATVHKELCNPQRIVISSKLAAEVYV